MFGPLLVIDGLAPGVVSLPAAISFAVTNPGPATFELKNDGSGTVGADGSAANWVTPGGAGAAQFYEARASGLSGDSGDATGTFDEWLALSSTRQWAVSGDNKQISFTIEIRDRFTQVVRDSSTVTISTTSE